MLDQAHINRITNKAKNNKVKLKSLVEEFDGLLGLNPKLDEKTFKEVFVPGFWELTINPQIQESLLKTKFEKGTKALHLQAWATVCNYNYQCPVDIVDEYGNTLFIVPPMIDSMYMEGTVANPALTMSMIIEEAMNKGSVLAHLGDDVLQEGLSLRFHKDPDLTEKYKTHGRFWYSVFKHYGYNVSLLDPKNRIKDTPKSDIIQVVNEDGSTDWDDPLAELGL